MTINSTNNYLYASKTKKIMKKKKTCDETKIR